MRTCICLPGVRAVPSYVRGLAMARTEQCSGPGPRLYFTDNREGQKRFGVDPLPMADNCERVLYRIRMDPYDTGPRGDIAYRPVEALKGAIRRGHTAPSGPDGGSLYPPPRLAHG